MIMIFSLDTGLLVLLLAAAGWNAVEIRQLRNEQKNKVDVDACHRDQDACHPQFVELWIAINTHSHTGLANDAKVVR